MNTESLSLKQCQLDTQDPRVDRIINELIPLRMKKEAGVSKNEQPKKGASLLIAWLR